VTYGQNITTFAQPATTTTYTQPITTYAQPTGYTNYVAPVGSEVRNTSYYAVGGGVNGGASGANLNSQVVRNTVLEGVAAPPKITFGHPQGFQAGYVTSNNTNTYISSHSVTTTCLPKTLPPLPWCSHPAASRPSPPTWSMSPGRW
jgi:hypothetical protein